MQNKRTTTADGRGTIECWLQVPIMTSRGALTRVGHLLLNVPEGNGDAQYTWLRPTLKSSQHESVEPVAFASFKHTDEPNCSAWYLASAVKGYS